MSFFSTTKKLYTKAFSLVEVLVSLSIFTFVVTASVSALLVMVDANRKAQNIQSVMTNMSFALDSMTRDLRTGQYYYCSDNAAALPTSGNTVRNCTNEAGISFREAGSSLTEGCTGDRVAYYFNSTDNSIQRRLCDGDWEPLTTSDVRVTDMQFTVSGAGTTDTAVPRVTIYIDGEVGTDADTQTAFNLQTTISQLSLDI